MAVDVWRDDDDDDDGITGSSVHCQASAPDDLISLNPISLANGE